MFSEALLHFERHGVTTKGLSLLKEAKKNNPFVVDYLLGYKKIQVKFLIISGLVTKRKRSLMLKKMLIYGKMQENF